MESTKRKKIWLESCIAGMSLAVTAASVHAQSSATLYGVTDIGLFYSSKTLNVTTGGNAGSKISLVEGNQSASRFGLRGVEDLGGGLKAVFTLESGINLANGGFANSNGNLFGRQAWIGLNGSFGSVKAGLQYSPFVLALIATDPRDSSYFGSGAVNYINNVLATGLFNPNAISYTTPILGGLQGSAMFAFGGKSGDFQSGRQYSGSLTYRMDGTLIDAAYYDGNAGGANPTPIPSSVAFRGWTIGAGYTYGALTLKGSFVNYKVAASFDSRVFGGGLGYKISPFMVVDGGVWYTSDGNNTANHSILFGSGVNYYLSKRTMLYGQVAVVNNHGAMDTGLSINGALFGTKGTTVGATLGIQHTF